MRERKGTREELLGRSELLDPFFLTPLSPLLSVASGTMGFPASQLNQLMRESLWYGHDFETGTMDNTDPWWWILPSYHLRNLMFVIYRAISNLWDLAVYDRKGVRTQTCAGCLEGHCFLWGQERLNRASKEYRVGIQEAVYWLSRSSISSDWFIDWKDEW